MTTKNLIPTASRRSVLAGSLGLAACGPRLDLAVSEPEITSELAGVVDDSWLRLGSEAQGVRLGVIDAGFGGFRTNEFTRDLAVAATRSFVEAAPADFFADPDRHGTEVCGYIGGRTASAVRGLASKATYLLAKGESQATELRADEAGVMAALDWMVSEAVQLINISLGYTTFDDEQPYTPAMMDGQTTRITRHLAGLLERDPMLVVVVSAGNQGRQEWRSITAPGDAEHAITVGSAERGGDRRRSSSGVGHPDVTFVKPDLVIASGRGGGSVAAAVVSGLVACLREARPNATRAEITTALRAAGSNAESPNRGIGYGVPNAMEALRVLQSSVS